MAGGGDGPQAVPQQVRYARLAAQQPAGSEDDDDEAKGNPYLDCGRLALLPIKFK